LGLSIETTGVKIVQEASGALAGDAREVTAAALAATKQLEYIVVP
jgi:hypothetical protein